MSLIVLSGKPGSGKTILANNLKKYFDEAGKDSIIVSEPSVEEGTFNSSHDETQGRSEYKAKVHQAFAPDRIVIADGMNFIKGFRYELWCFARESACTFCCAFCDVDDDVAYERAKARYPDHKLRDLISRLEPPSEKNKWDRPLVIVKDPNDPKVLEAISQNITAKGTKLTPRKATNAVKAGAKVSGSSDRIINEFCKELVQVQNEVPPGSEITIMGAKFTLKKPLNSAEIKRAKRDFGNRLKSFSSDANIPQLFADSLSVLF